ncbi:MAG TPA: secondary thiamine-phosphate synthase enzyme YjbQ [Candidatus Methylomirabilis sp.]|nr:secondary thiamine-phosphate synthase enzyme YjbQ [Candidatus Methylomirabilis sp.]
MVEEFSVRTKRKFQVIDITENVREIVERAAAREGLCCVFVPHSTAAVTVNENADPNIGEDLQEALAKLIPEGVWRHDRVDDNAAAHIKAAIIGPSETVPLRNGTLLLGTWQSLMLVEFDGPRERKVFVQLR